MAREPYMFSRWDPLNPTNIVAAILIGWAISVYHRPSLPLLLPSYSRFDDVMPWAYWGWWALVAGVLLLATPRSSVWRTLAHVVSGMFFLAVTIAFGTGVGTTSGVTTYMVLTGVSGILFARTAVHWVQGMAWWDRLVECPPPWLKRLARLEEPQPSPLEDDEDA